MTVHIPYTESAMDPHNIVYNVTIKMDRGIAEACLQWLLAVQAPQIVATGCFTGFKAFHLLDMDDAEGITYAIQYFGNSIHHYQYYLEEYEDRFLQETHTKWGQGIALFGTVMRAVN
ncbi:MAG TPA: DUF4286 family protein [Chitinophagaceae bacterium]|nr:DUF4286 family protein [Chitinophagaceae bacterium]